MSETKKLLPTLWRSRVVQVVVALVVVGAIAGGWIWHARALPKNAAFRWGDVVATKADLREKATAMRALYGIELPAEGKERRQFWKDLAKSEALGRIMADQARKKDLTVSSGEAEAALTKFVEQVYGSGSDGEKTFADALVTAGTSRDAVVAEIRRQLLTLELYDKVTGDIKEPTEVEAKGAFERWTCHFGTPERRRLSNVVVLDEKSAKEAVAALAGGSPWASVVKTYSQDQATVDKGGDLGLRSEDELDAAYAEAAFSAERGRVFGPVKTEGGWNIGRVESVVAHEPAAFEDVKAAVMLAELNQRKSKSWRTWITKQLKAADVEYADSYRPQDPYAAPDEREMTGQEQLSDCESGDTP